jgi:hypothetical protein
MMGNEGVTLSFPVEDGTLPVVFEIVDRDELDELESDDEADDEDEDDDDEADEDDDEPEEDDGLDALSTTFGLISFFCTC